MKYYRKKYIISVYDDDDRNIAVLDNIQQFASFFGISRENASMQLSNLFNHKTEYMKKDDAKLSVYFYEWNDSEYDLKGA